MPRLRVEDVLQSVGIESLHAIDDHGVEPRRGCRVVVMRKVRAGDEQGTASGQRAAETVAKRRGSLRSLKSHHERHDCRSRRKTLHERQLHLERMLTLVSGRMLAND